MGKKVGKLLEIDLVSADPVLKAAVLAMLNEINVAGIVGISAMSFFFPSRNTFITVRLEF